MFLLFHRGLFERYLPLLVYPCSNVRYSAVIFVNASCRSVGFPDAFVFLLPLLRPYLRFEPSTNHLTVRSSSMLSITLTCLLKDRCVQTEEGLERCLIAPWTRSKLNEELARLTERSRDANLGTQWMSVGGIHFEIQETKKEDDRNMHAQDYSPLNSSALGGEEKTDRPSIMNMNECMIDYLTMLQRSRGANATGMERISACGPVMSIEGSLKLAQHVKFPNQFVAGTKDFSIPSWYTALRDDVSGRDHHSSETSAIRSVSSLSQGENRPSP